MEKPRVVIVGGGFGGLAAARVLVGERVDVTMLDDRNYHLFTPLLYQVATALLNPSDIAYPLRARFRRARNVRFHEARVDYLDLDERIVGTSSGERIPYDYLLLASGSKGDYFGKDELRETTIGLKTLEDALRLRNHVLAALNSRTREPDDAERGRLLTFVVAGGGPTGVEYAGALSELLRLVLGRDYPELPPVSARVVLVEGRDRLLEALPEHLGRYAERKLRQLGVEVRLNTFLEGATDATARLSGGDEIPTRTVVWTAGVRPQVPAIEGNVVRSRSRRLVVDDRLRIPGAEGTFAIGDVAAIGYRDGELPMLSAPAMQAGRFVARQILAEVSDQQAPARSAHFRYVNKGVMATIGRHAAVGAIGRFTFSGFFGWLMWLVVHLYYLVGFRNRIAVFALWGWNYLRKDRPIRIIAPAHRDALVERLLGGDAEREVRRRGGGGARRGAFVGVSMALESEARSVGLEGDELVIVWADEHVSRFELVDLRRSCPCAQCRELRDRGEKVWPRAGVPDVLEVTDAELAGGWGLSLRWNDRHETGIYPWETLRAWCPCDLCAR